MTNACHSMAGDERHEKGGGGGVPVIEYQMSSIVLHQLHTLGCAGSANNCHTCRGIQATKRELNN